MLARRHVAFTLNYFKKMYTRRELKMTKFFSALCLFVLQIVNCRAEIEDSCTTVAGRPGVCINVHSCQLFLDVSRGIFSNPITTWVLRKNHCGFNGNSPKTCCPVHEKDKKLNHIDSVTKPTTTKKLKTKPQQSNTPIMSPKTSTLPPTTSTLPPTTSTLPQATSTKTLKTPTVPRASKKKSKGIINYDLLSLLGETCTTIYNTTGSCSDVHLCEPLLDMLKQARSDPAVANMVRKAQCGFKNSIPQVCCPLPGQSSSLVSSTPGTAKRAEDFLDSFPEPPVCGASGADTVHNRVVGGVPAKLGALPWMALLAYRDHLVSGVRWKCGGSLISSRHVLTAAHCIHRQEDQLFLVRLGELDLAREDEGATPIDVLIKEMIKHEQYSRNDLVLYDIGVLVLDRDVEFTRLIRPICIVPEGKWRSSTFEAHNPLVAGWGRTKWGGPLASHLQMAQLTVLSDTDCKNAYRQQIQRSWDQFSTPAMCASAEGLKVDTCTGDSGGPLMMPIPNAKFKYHFYAIGVVSFGRKCAIPESPGVYTRVAAYLPWLEEKVLGRTRPA